MHITISTNSIQSVQKTCSIAHFEHQMFSFVMRVKMSRVIDKLSL